MMGAIVFIIVFLFSTWYSLNYSLIPPGEAIYNPLGVPETSYPVLGYPATLLVEAVFNGVVYGFIAWLIFTILMMGKHQLEEREKRKLKRELEEAKERREA